MTAKLIRLGEFAKVKGGKRLPKGAELLDDETEHAYIRVTDMLDDGLEGSQVKYIDNKTHDSIRRYTITSNDVYISIAGTIGRVGMVPNKFNLANLTENAAKITEISDEFNPRFLMYFLRSHYGQGQIAAKTGGTSQPKLALYRIEEIECPSVSRSIQDEIVSIISRYDDLIENNKRRIELLEESARQLYKEWFVRFRFPGHEHVKIIDGVPEGWTIESIKDVCSKFVDGDWIESKDQGGEDFRILQISNIGMDSFVETGNYRYVSDRTFDRLKCDEVLPGDCLIARMPKGIGRAWLVTKMPWKMVTAVDVTIARADPAKVDVFYFLYHLNSAQHIARCEAGATGATRPRVSRRVMGGLPILLPPESLQLEFSEFANDIHYQKQNLQRQIEALQKARDILLPKLMNGEVAV